MTELINCTMLRIFNQLDLRNQCQMLVHQIIKLWYAMTSQQIMNTLLVFIGFLLMTYCIQWLKYIRTLPPGPWGLPISGYLPFIKGPMHLHFIELSKKYGSVFSVRFGSNLAVVFSDYRIIRDAFRREEFTGRPRTGFMNILEGYGIVNSDGPLWKDQRKFLHEKLRNFGMTFVGNGKKNLESAIMYEVNVFLRGLQRGTPTNISPSLGMAISNVICSIIMGVRFHQGDLQFSRFMDLINEGFKLFSKIVFSNHIPLLRCFWFLQGTSKKIAQNRAEMAAFFQEKIDEHRATYNENRTRDFIDIYLHEIQKAKIEGREDQLFHGKNPDRQMQQVLGDLFSAGMETMKTTLEWAVIFMLHNPEAAKAVQNELDEVVGRSRMPSLDDIPYLPITDATIQEILRRSSVVPLGTTHAATRDVMFNGYMIPAGTEVTPLLYGVHMDPQLWDEPEAFRPERFLSSEGKVCKPDYFMPFGVGRRMCLGDKLARMELFLFFTGLMHTFDLSLPEGAALPNLQGNVGTTISPESFEVCLTQRDLNLVDCASNEATTNGPLRNVGSH